MALVQWILKSSRTTLESGGENRNVLYHILLYYSLLFMKLGSSVRLCFDVEIVSL